MKPETSVTDRRAAVPPQTDERRNRARARRIVVEPHGGLGNRMRAIDSCLALASHLGQELEIVWVRSAELNSGFHDLFQPIEGVSGVIEVDAFRCSGSIRFRVLLPLQRLWRRAYRDRDLHSLKTVGYDFRNVAGRKLHYHICHPFYPNPEAFRKFVPIERLRREVELYRFPGRVGVHIRRADNVKATSGSPTWRFLELMDVEAERNPNVTFFLATDSQADEELLRSRFPNRIVSHSKRTLDRRESEAASDALIDLYALSQCDKIIGSYFSSFTDVAAMIGRVPKVIVRASN